MTSFEAFLETEKPDAHAIEQAARYYLALRTDYLSPAAMRAELSEAGVDEAELGMALEDLQQNPAALEAASVEFLAAAWEEPGQEALIRDAFREATSKLPVVELAILATVAMYGMYLLATGGVKRKETKRRAADGSTTDTTVEYEPPTGPLDRVWNAVRPLAALRPGKPDQD